MAVRTARQACKSQDLDGCKQLAELFAKRSDLSRGALAGHILRPFCEAGDGETCLLMAELITIHQSLKLPIYRLACDAGALEGCLRQAINRKDFSPAERLASLQDACADVHIFACRMQAEFLENTPGVSATPKADRARSEALFRFACENDDMLACNGLGGFLYERGRRSSGDPDELRESLALFEKACEAENASACYRLGVHYEYDADLKENALEKALQYYGAACQLEPHRLCASFESSTLQKERNKLRVEHGVLASALMAHEADFKVDYQARVRRYRRDCSEGDLEHCIALGDRYVDKLEIDGIYVSTH